MYTFALGYRNVMQTCFATPMMTCYLENASLRRCAQKVVFILAWLLVFRRLFFWSAKANQIYIYIYKILSLYLIGNYLVNPIVSRGKMKIWSLHINFVANQIFLLRNFLTFDLDHSVQSDFKSRSWNWKWEYIITWLWSCLYVQKKASKYSFINFNDGCPLFFFVSLGNIGCSRISGQGPKNERI